MEPFSPNDPLSKLLGQAKPVQVRGNFAKSVVRAARQTPQERGLLAAIKSWFRDADLRLAPIACAAAAVALAAGLIVFSLDRKADSDNAPMNMAQTSAPAPAAAAIGTDSPTEIESEAPVPPAVETQWTTMDHLDAVVAVEDTSQLTDREIASLLY